MFYKTKSLKSTRQWLWDAYVRMGSFPANYSGMKKIRELFRSKLFTEAKLFMATCPYDTLTITLRRSHNDDSVYHMDCRGSDTVTPEIEEIFSNVEFKSN